jgi:hypothetical protein
MSFDMQSWRLAGRQSASGRRGAFQRHRKMFSPWNSEQVSGVNDDKDREAGLNGWLFIQWMIFPIPSSSTYGVLHLNKASITQQVRTIPQRKNVVANFKGNTVVFHSNRHWV